MVARSRDVLPFLVLALTEENVANYFKHLFPTGASPESFVSRYSNSSNSFLSIVHLSFASILSNYLWCNFEEEEFYSDLNLHNFLDIDFVSGTTWRESVDWTLYCDRCWAAGEWVRCAPTLKEKHSVRCCSTCPFAYLPPSPALFLNDRSIPLMLHSLLFIIVRLPGELAFTDWFLNRLSLLYLIFFDLLPISFVRISTSYNLFKLISIILINLKASHLLLHTRFRNLSSELKPNLRSQIRDGQEMKF